MPPEAKVSWPGAALAAAAISSGVFAGLDGWTVITLETADIGVIGMIACGS
jgi:hypothetical protein